VGRRDIFMKGLIVACDIGEGRRKARQSKREGRKERREGGREGGRKSSCSAPNAYLRDIPHRVKDKAARRHFQAARNLDFGPAFDAVPDHGIVTWGDRVRRQGEREGRS
jgi:hypothetical protein